MLNAATTATNDALGKVLNSLNGVENFNIDYTRPSNQRSPGPPMSSVINDYLNSKVPEPPGAGGDQNNMMDNQIQKPYSGNQYQKQKKNIQQNPRAISEYRTKTD